LSYRGFCRPQKRIDLPELGRDEQPIVLPTSATPLFRRRLDEKFRRGAENQAFLVESVTGIETLKALAVEPQMQRRWEEQLAGYVAASFRVLSLGNTASQIVQLVSKIVTTGILYFGARPY